MGVCAGSSSLRNNGHVQGVGAERAWAPACEHQEHGDQAYTLRFLDDAGTRRELPESESAKDHYRQAPTLADELGMRPLLAHCHHGLGKLYLKAGQPGQAHTELATAIALYRAMDMTCWLTQAEATLAMVHSHDS